MICEPQDFAFNGTAAVGLLCLPEGEGWYPAVVVAGEPPADTGAALTEALVGHGFAVLTFDAPASDLAPRLAAAADSLLMRPDVRPELIGLLGFGAGAWAAAQTAARAPETAFAVLVPEAAALPSAEALKYLAGVLCPALVLSPDEAITPTLAEALAHNPDAHLRPAPATPPALYDAIAAWLQDHAA